MQRSAPPELQQQLTQARSQYKAMKTIEDLVEKSPTGNISPTLLMGAVRGSYGNMAYNGGGDLGQLARIGQQFLKPPPNSGTAERTHVLEMLGALGAGAGGIAAGASPISTLGVAGAGMIGLPLAARGANYLLNNPMTRNALMQRALGNTAPRLVNPLVAGTSGPVGQEVSGLIP
jgi:hypothetical protein